jgi:hypothetical protein
MIVAMSYQRYSRSRDAGRLMASTLPTAGCWGRRGSRQPTRARAPGGRGFYWRETRAGWTAWPTSWCIVFIGGMGSTVRNGVASWTSRGW